MINGPFCLLFLPLSVGVLFFMHCPYLNDGDIAGLFTLIVLLVSCDCWCSVALSQGAMCWSAVSECIS